MRANCEIEETDKERAREWVHVKRRWMFTMTPYSRRTKLVQELRNLHDVVLDILNELAIVPILYGRAGGRRGSRVERWIDQISHMALQHGKRSSEHRSYIPSGLEQGLQLPWLTVYN